MREVLTCIDKEKSQFDAHKDKNRTFSVHSILIIWDALLSCFCSKGIRSFSTLLWRPSEVQWIVSRGCRMDLLAWLAEVQTDDKCVSCLFSPRWWPRDSKWGLLALATSETTLLLKTVGRGSAMLCCRAYGKSDQKARLLLAFHLRARQVHLLLCCSLSW